MSGEQACEQPGTGSDVCHHVRGFQADGFKNLGPLRKDFATFDFKTLSELFGVRIAEGVVDTRTHAFFLSIQAVGQADETDKQQQCFVAGQTDHDETP